MKNTLKHKIFKGTSRFIIYSTLIIFAIFFLVPVYVLLVTALKSFKEISIDNMWSIPSSITFAPFLKALKKLLPNLLNSFFLVIPATLISSIVGSVNGYMLSKWKFKGANVIFIIILFGMFIPYQSILIPLVQIINKGFEGIRFLYNSFGWGRVPGHFRIVSLILVHVIYGIPITTLIFRNYYTEIPDELLEASFIDGCGMISTYLKIIFPISAPGFVVVIIWQFTSVWNEFLFAVTITQRPDVQPITVALQNLAGSQIVEWNVQMAGALIAALPTLIIYILLGKFFIRGLLAGSIKS